MSGMKKAVAPPVFLRAAETLLAYVGNLVAYPGDPKFRRIKACRAPPHARQHMPPPHLATSWRFGPELPADQVRLHPFVAAALPGVRIC